MLKAVKFLFVGIVILFILVTAALFAITSLLDPNDYKPEIENAIQESTGFHININGAIDWSIYPWLGLELSEIQVNTTEGAPFTTLDNMQFRVALMSLVKMSPRADKLVIDGLQLNLEKDSKGVGNWEKLSDREALSANDEQDTEKTATETAKPNQEQDFDFTVSEIVLANINVNYTDKPAGRTIVLSPLNVTATDISTDSPIPVKIDFTLSDSQSGISTDGKLKTTVTLSKDLKRTELSPFSAKFALSGKPFGSETVNTAINTAITLDTAGQTLSVANMSLTLENLAAIIDLQISEIDKTPKINGSAKIVDFSLQKLLTNLGQKPIPTTDDKVLKKIAFSTSLKSPGNQISLPDIQLTLDDTVFKGNASIDQKTSRILARLDGNAIDIDRYSPPEQKEGTQEQARTTPSPDTTPGGTAPDDSLPIEMLKGLNFDLSANLQQLVAQNMTIQDIAIQTTAKNGIIKLNKAAGKLYKGDFLATADINVKAKKPTWKLHSEINRVELLPMLKDFRELTLLAGNLNFKADIASTGKNLTQLQNNADGTASFNIDKGALEGVNLQALACKGAAQLQGKKVDISQRPPLTSFNDMSGTVKINGRIISNPSLIASLAGIALGGHGQVNTADNTLEYGLDLKVVGELGDPNCEVNKYIKDIAIPVKCTGSIGGETSPDCGLDTTRMSDMVKQIARREATRKIDKAIDRKLGKWLNKKEKNQEGSTDSRADTEKQQEKEDKKEAVKGLIKGLFN
ncbi:MAG: hypothetical protein CSA52_01620 [Gammaproteobacteria bacterium]|nr:MAG: hypothetical protein CSB48_09510 [Pseudomonadota bacterium]PIE38669.1 MAG: hypothetical protein CSA52_01620 [Gammaproteobacteria bacterium]